MSRRIRISGKALDIPTATQEWEVSTRPGGWWIATSKKGERKRFVFSDEKGRAGLSIQGKSWTGDWLEEENDSNVSGSSDDSTLVAQFPGKVRKVLVAPGAQVNEGDPLILVEAMKMEFAIKAPTKGIVSRILVQEGQQLSPGDLFFYFESVKNV